MKNHFNWQVVAFNSIQVGTGKCIQKNSGKALPYRYLLVIAYRYYIKLLDLLEVHVGDVVVGRAIAMWRLLLSPVTTGLCARLGVRGVVHVL